MPIKLGTVRHGVSIWLLGIFGCGTGFAQSSQGTIRDYVHTAWGEKEGAPKSIHAIAQTQDGFLWIGCHDGLARFDGVSFEHYEPASGPSLPAGPANALLALPNGDLWIGFSRGGITLLRDGRAVNYSSPERLLGGHVQSFAQDGAGAIWAGTSTGLARFDGNRWLSVGADWNFPAGTAGSLFVDREGTLWVVTQDTMVRLPKGARSFQPTSVRYNGQISQIAEARNGKLWMAETTRSVRPVPLGAKSLPSDDTEVRVGSAALLFAQDGDLWIPTLGDGLRRVPAPEELQGKPDGSSASFESYTVKDGLTDNVGNTIYQDREGNIWVGSFSGLDRFRKSSFTQIALPAANPFFELTPAYDGEIWVNSTVNVARTSGSAVSSEAAFKRPKGFWEATYRAPGGTVWWVYADELVRSDRDRFTRTPLPKVLADAFAGRSLPTALTEDQDGVLWVDIAGEGLFYRKADTWSRFNTPAGLRELHPIAAFTDGSGRVWFGYDEGTIVYLQRGEIHSVSGNKDSPVGNVRVVEGRNQQVWIGGTTGLAFFDGKRMLAVVPSDAAMFANVSGIEETADGSLWLRESRGVTHIRGEEVRRFLETPTYRVHYQLFDALDGLSGRFEPYTRQKEVVDDKGRLWFGTETATARLDPASIDSNVSPPPVAIRAVIADGKRFPVQNDPILPPLLGRLEIDYAGLNLSAPERVRLRYMLEGTDKDWQDGGTSRQAFYTNLAPGKHRFRLNAQNVGGEWNAQDMVMEFSVAPAWFQTFWFKAVCAGFGCLLLWLFYRIRVRQVARAISVRFDERLHERTRLARDLHDTLLQTIQASKYAADAAIRTSTDTNPMRGSMEELSEWLGQAIEEGRAAVNSLRTSTTETNDLAEGFRRAIEECRLQSSLDATFAVVGKVSEMHPIVRDEVYRIGYEGIRNACAHSQASKLQVELTYAEDLVLRVRDNGVGIAAAILDEGKEGHFGLQGMRERAGRILAKLTVESSAEGGTEVKLVVPGRIIYRSQTSGERKRSLLKALLERMGLTSKSTDL